MNNTEDELALQNLMAAYVDAANRRDPDAWAATWADDGTWNLVGLEAQGMEAMLALWQQLVAGFEFAIMMPSSCQFQIDGDTATGYWYLQEYTRDLEGQAGFALSRYEDEYVRRDGKWLYSKRSYKFMYQGQAEMPGNFTPLS